ncbi:MAG TPA: hypothetical protein PLH65_02365 [bacterium]|nr:hypothetical protein [bacterium]
MKKLNSKHLRSLVGHLIELIHDTEDKEILKQLELITWELKPLIEHPDSGIDPALGRELWLYVGDKKDANPEMAKECGKNIDYWFEKTKPPWNE